MLRPPPTPHAHPLSAYVTVAGTSFTRYFPDRKLGGEKKSLAVAEQALKELRAIIDGAKRVDGKLTATTVSKVRKLLEKAY